MVMHHNTIPVTTGDFIQALHKYWWSPRIHWKYTVVYYDIYRSRPTTLLTIPVTTDDFIHDTGHDRRLYTRLTQLCEVPQNTLKIHGRVLWHIPITTDDFVNVSHNYWGSGRPASVSDTTTTAVLCPSSRL